MSDLRIEVSGPVLFTVAYLGPPTLVCGPPVAILTRSCDSSWTSNGSSDTIHCDAVNVIRATFRVSEKGAAPWENCR